MNMLNKLFHWFSKKNRDERKYKKESQLRFHHYINNGHIIIEAEFGPFLAGDIPEISDYIAIYLSNLSNDYRSATFVSLRNQATNNNMLDEVIKVSLIKLQGLVGVSNKPKKSITPFNAKI